MKIRGMLRAAALLVMMPLAAGMALGQATAPSVTKRQQDKVITPAQAKQLFASVDAILKFVSSDTDLPIKHPVKRRLVTRAEVVKYLKAKMRNGKEARRMERSQIVLKKFGMLDEDFQLQPFLVSLLKEQIAGYYDAKTKTVNLLDWVPPDAQKPVLAHELTHALQGQYVNLVKWESRTKENISHNAAEDNRHIATDEEDTARQAVLEGQAMAVLINYELKPTGRDILSNPAAVKRLADRQGSYANSPVLARAPLVLQESLLFPYKEGLKFEVDMLEDKGTKGAFAGVLNHPPSSTFQVMTPRAYQENVKIPTLTMPDVHPLIRAKYNPYDVGTIGELDVRMLTQLFGGSRLSAQLTPQWDGGIYFVAQKKSAVNKDSTASVAMFYLSRWKTPQAAAVFAKMYAGEIGQQYFGVKRDSADESVPNERIFDTNEGPMLILRQGRLVFVSESFPLPLARKLQFLLTSAQGGNGQGVETARMQPAQSLTSGLRSLIESCGMMRAALHLY